LTFGKDKKLPNLILFHWPW